MANGGVDLPLRKLCTCLLSNCSKDNDGVTKLAGVTAICDALDRYRAIKSELLRQRLLDELFPILDYFRTGDNECDDIRNETIIAALQLVTKLSHYETNEKILRELNNDHLLVRLLVFCNTTTEFFCHTQEFNELFTKKTSRKVVQAHVRTSTNMRNTLACIKDATGFDADQLDLSGIIYECEILTNSPNDEKSYLTNEFYDADVIWPGIKLKDFDTVKTVTITITNVLDNGLFFAHINKDSTDMVETINQHLSHGTLAKPFSNLPSIGENVIAVVSVNGISESQNRARVLAVNRQRKKVDVFCVDSGHIVRGVDLFKLHPMYHGVDVTVTKFRPRIQLCVLSGIHEKPKNLEMCCSALSALCNMAKHNLYVSDYLTTNSTELKDFLPLLLAPDWSVAINSARMLGNILAVSAKAKSINLTQLVKVTLQSLKKYTTTDAPITTNDDRHMEARLYLLNQCLNQGNHVKNILSENGGLTMMMSLHKRLSPDSPVRDRLNQLISVYMGDGSKLSVEVWDQGQQSKEEEIKKRHPRSLMYRKTTNTTQYYPTRQEQMRQNMGRSGRVDDRFAIHSVHILPDDCPWSAIADGVNVDCDANLYLRVPKQPSPFHRVKVAINGERPDMRRSRYNNPTRMNAPGSSQNRPQNNGQYNAQQWNIPTSFPPPSYANPNPSSFPTPSYANPNPQRRNGYQNQWPRNGQDSHRPRNTNNNTNNDPMQADHISAAINNLLNAFSGGM